MHPSYMHTPTYEAAVLGGGPNHPTMSKDRLQSMLCLESQLLIAAQSHANKYCASVH